jgi:hypothetical protein
VILIFLNEDVRMRMVRMRIATRKIIIMMMEMTMRMNVHSILISVNEHYVYYMTNAYMNVVNIDVKLQNDMDTWNNMMRRRMMRGRKRIELVRSYNS